MFNRQNKTALAICGRHIRITPDADPEMVRRSSIRSGADEPDELTMSAATLRTSTSTVVPLYGIWICPPIEPPHRFGDQSHDVLRTADAVRLPFKDQIL